MRLGLGRGWRGGRTVPPDDIDFDAAAYLQRYPDVARAVKNGAFESAWAHFHLHGKSEGRSVESLTSPALVGLDETTLVRTLPSPGFETKPPRVLNGEKIPLPLRSHLEALWHEPPRPRTVACHLLHDVVVVGDGLVFDMAGRLVSATVHQTSAAAIERATVKVRRYIDDGPGPGCGGTTLLCEKAGLSNYGHWLVEMAPIAFALRDQLRGDWFLRAPFVEGSAGMSAVIRDTIDLLGIDPARVRWAIGSVPQRYETLVVTSGLSQHGWAYSPLAADALAAMAETIPAERRGKVWVSRAETSRRIRDEAELCDVLAAEGWSIVSPATMSLRRQIAVFKGAEIVAGVAGAGLTNIGFAAPCTPVVTFVPARMPVVFFYFLAQMRAQPYAEIRCTQQNDHDGPHSWDGVLEISAKAALRSLRSMI